MAPEEVHTPISLTMIGLSTIAVESHTWISMYSKHAEYLEEQYSSNSNIDDYLRYATIPFVYSLRSNHYYVDSKKLPVCDNRRIHSNRVFEDFATRGRGSTGWFCAASAMA